jgi:hypothetical protein
MREMINLLDDKTYPTDQCSLSIKDQQLSYAKLKYDNEVFPFIREIKDAIIFLQVYKVTKPQFIQLIKKLTGSN